MAQYAREDAVHPLIQAATREAIGAMPRRAPNAYWTAEAIHRWIRRRVRFVDDSSLAGFRPSPAEAEVLIRPADLVAMPDPQGDCDDSSMLCAAMLRAAGIPAVYKTVAANPLEPDVYSHVYTVALLPDGPLPLDCSTQAGVDPRPGREVPAAGKSRLWPIEETMHRLSGMGVNWDALTNLATKGLDITGSIMKSRYAVPQLAPGQFLQQDGSVYYQQQPGSGPLAFPGVGVGGSTGGWLLLGGIALLAILLATRGGR